MAHSALKLIPVNSRNAATVHTLAIKDEERLHHEPRLLSTNSDLSRCHAPAGNLFGDGNRCTDRCTFLRFGTRGRYRARQQCSGGYGNQCDRHVRTRRSRQQDNRGCDGAMAQATGRRTGKTNFHSANSVSPRGPDRQLDRSLPHQRSHHSCRARQ